MLGRTTQIDHNSLWAVLTPAGRRRFAPASKLSRGESLSKVVLHLVDTTTKQKSPRDAEALLFGRTTQIDHNSLWAVLTPAGRRRFAPASKLSRGESLSKVVLHLVDTTTKQKSPRDAEALLFGRTTQIRTGDLYHVKVAL